MSWCELLNVIAKLRAPDGCPWDRKQTQASLKRYLLEETYELFEAIDQGDGEGILDELGDVLLQVLLHAQIASEEGTFTIEDVLENLKAKLIRRHPHVFAGEKADTPGEVIVKWDQVKRTEKKSSARKSVLDGVPAVFPALMRAEKIQQKAAKVGFDWENTPDVFVKIQEELEELGEALNEKDQAAVQEELGDLLFATVNLARFVEIDPEFALQAATGKFARRFRIMEEKIKEQKLKIEDLNLSELDVFWERAKLQLRKNPHS